MYNVDLIVDNDNVNYDKMNVHIPSIIRDNINISPCNSINVISSSSDEKTPLINVIPLHNNIIVNKESKTKFKKYINYIFIILGFLIFIAFIIIYFIYF